MSTNSTLLTPITSTTCLNYIDVNPDPTNSTLAIIIFTIVYTHLFLLGIVGNVAVMYLTMRHRSLQTVQNIFILNLAAADVIVCLLSLPFTPVTSVFKVWLFGKPICHLLPLIQGVGVFISTFSLSAIAIDRYVLVVRPYTHPLNVRGAFIVAAVLWALSAIFTLPYAFYMDLQQYANVCGVFCTEIWPNANARRAYTLIVLVAQFLIPFAIMIVCYGTIFQRLRLRAENRLRKLNERSHLLETSSTAIIITNGVKNNTKHHHRLSPPIEMEKNDSSGRSERIDSSAADMIDYQRRQKQQLLAQQRRTTTILACQVLIFGLTWLPHNIVSLIIEYDESSSFFNRSADGGPNLVYLISMITHSISMVNNLTNPVLYAWLNPTFRDLLIYSIGALREGVGNQRKSMKASLMRASMTTTLTTTTTTPSNIQRPLATTNGAGNAISSIRESTNDDESCLIRRDTK